jgi:radical SAM/Cys-rich protein
MSGSIKSLLSRQSPLASGTTQLAHLGDSTPRLRALPRFSEKLKGSGLSPFHPQNLEIFQINLGKMCNQTCKHCHVDAGPDRREIMSQETMQLCLDVLKDLPVPLVDLTGGAPEMNPNFRWFVEELTALGKTVMDRCNLTIILANEKFHDLPEFFAKNRVKVISSLPYYQKGFTDRQRGEGVFERSVRALKMLNQVGYGIEGSGLELDLVYNPNGAFLPGSQASLQKDFKRELKQLFGIDFNQLYAITNMPISRFLEYLEASGNLEDYMEKLVQSYNPAAAQQVMCRNTLSVGWDGRIYDCDFNQMLEIGVGCRGSSHVSRFDLKELSEREIQVDQHCYGCTAGSGSSCGGSTT